MAEHEATFEGYAYRTSCRFGTRSSVRVRCDGHRHRSPGGSPHVSSVDSHTSGHFLADRSGAAGGGGPVGLEVSRSRVGAGGHSLGVFGSWSGGAYAPAALTGQSFLLVSWVGMQWGSIAYQTTLAE